MITDTSWIVMRHPYAFLPPPWQVNLCRRKMQVQVLPDVTERRFKFTLDIHSGQNWARQGTGEYEYWTHIPPIQKWCTPEMVPPLDCLCIFWIQGGCYSGLHVGRVRLGTLQHVIWEFQEPYSAKWSRTISSNLGGWLLLHQS
jgi:hypothetical protein